MSIPRHWSQKRKYLQGKRGLDKPPFKLPEFIEATGISEQPAGSVAQAQAQSHPCLRPSLTSHPAAGKLHSSKCLCWFQPCNTMAPPCAGEMRQAYLEKVEGQKMKQKARERMQPKMGKLDIDYQVGAPACPPGSLPHACVASQQLPYCGVFCRVAVITLSVPRRPAPLRRFCTTPSSSTRPSPR